MTILKGWKLVALLLLCAATTIAAPAQVFTTLVNFEGADGAVTTTPLIQGLDGSFYGTTSGGGANNSPNCSNDGCGTVFRITPDGSLTTLYDFCSQTNCTDGAEPGAGLVLATDGNFYGTTQGGGGTPFCTGCGTVFRITPGGELSTIYRFCVQQYCSDGDDPAGALVQGADGSFYGSTISGGVNGTFGSVFRITSAGAMTSLYSFCSKPYCADGENPDGGLVQGPDGNFYGTTRRGGSRNCGFQNGCGTVFKITPNGKLTTGHVFCATSGCPDGSGPSALAQGSDGNFYGTTSLGTIRGGVGTIYRITPAGTLAVLYNFCSQPNCGDGIEPVGDLVQANDGNLYGTTTGGGDITCDPFGFGGGCGTVFEFSLSDRTLSTLHDFEFEDGYNPFGALLQATSGTFYGTTPYGGQPACSLRFGCGTVFSLSTGLGAFVRFVHNPAKVAGVFGILGQDFVGTTSVSLNGTPASFTVISNTLIKATVPAGATTGYVTVTTPSGTLTSNVPFRVIP